MKSASRLKDVNFREYFIRITKDDFRAFQKSQNSEADFIALQETNLGVLSRQAVIQNMYYSDSFATKR